MNVACLVEAHTAPYHFPDRPVKGYRDKAWHDTVEPHAIPLIFPIIELPCECSVNVSADMDTEGCLTVDWDGGERQSQWVVSVEGQSLHVTDTVDTCRWQRCGLSADKRYTVRVRSRCDNLRTYSWSAWSEAAVVNPMAGIVDIESNASFRLYPNPTKDIVTVEIGEWKARNGEQRIQIVDIEGRVVESAAATGQKFDIDVSHLSPGVYFVCLGSAKQKLTVMK